MKNKDTYKNSELDRAKPRHSFHAFINKTFKRHRADTTGLIEDGTNSSTVVRIIIGLILVHLIVIGGVLLRSHFVKNDPAVASSGVTAPPKAPEAQAQAPAASPAQPANVAASQANHITNPAIEDDLVAEEEPDTVQVTHLTATGDTLTSVAHQYNVNVAALKKANPRFGEQLPVGVYLQIPVSANSDAAKNAPKTVAKAPAPKEYTVVKGDTLSKIARGNNMSVDKLMKINNLTAKDAKKIRPGQKLKLSE